MGGRSIPRTTRIAHGRWLALKPSRFVLACACSASIVLGCSSLAVASHTLPPKFPVNTTTAGKQTNSAVAELTNDGFVVAWQEAEYGYPDNVVTRRFDSSGGAVGAETVLVREYATGDQEPDVAALPDGYVLVAERFHYISEGYSIVGQRYVADGSTLGETFRVNTRTAGYQRRPAVAVLRDGGFVVTWEAMPATHPGQGDGSGSGVYAQRYDASGSPAGSESRVNTYTTGGQGWPDVAAMTGGGFVIVWGDEQRNGVYGQRYRANGNPSGGEFYVKAATLAPDSGFGPRVAPLAGGGFVVAFDGHAVLFDAGSTPQGVAGLWPGPCAIAGLASGGFVVAVATEWQSDTSSYDILGAKYDASGAQDGFGYYFVYESNDQVDPALAALDGGFVLMWTHYTSLTGYDQNIFGRIFAGAPGTITGTSGPDNLFGTTGTDTIDGKGGADVMTGLLGDDLYYVQDPGDVVIEAVAEGTDTAKSSVTYTLPVNVENLILTGTLAINGAGNSLNNTLTGNSANNVVNGRAGADIIKGRAGNDALIGGPGSDTLTGGTGQDRFTFNSALSSTNIDRITDFTPVDDVIRLDKAVFTSLAEGPLGAAAFRNGTVATTAAHRVLYDLATGYLRYDADGTGPAAAVRFATLTTRPAITNADFYAQ